MPSTARAYSKDGNILFSNSHDTYDGARAAGQRMAEDYKNDPRFQIVLVSDDVFGSTFATYPEITNRGMQPSGYPEYVPCDPTNTETPFSCPKCGDNVRMSKTGPANETVTINSITGEEVDVEEFSFDDVTSRKWECRAFFCGWTAPAEVKA